MKLHLRAAWKALRGYAVAQENRASTWSPSGGSANGEVGMAAASVARRARDALHIFRKRRPGQLRDVSWLAPVLLR
ncbi:MAG: hypothetical protein ACK5X3_15550, partial [Pseudomonadota bacterium]